MKRITLLSAFCALVLLSSCSRLMHWTYHTFHEPDYIKVDLMPVRYRFLRTIRAYDQLNTVALFDVLWLSYEVIDAYSILYALRRGQDKAYEASIRECRLDELERDSFSFIVLIAQEDGLAFGNLHGKWGVALEIENRTYCPKKVSIIDDFEYEYKAIFGDFYNRFKTPYLVQFDAYDEYGSPVMPNSSDLVSLLFTTVDYREYCTFALEGPPEGPGHHQHTY